jgi:hypothetical protein
MAAGGCGSEAWGERPTPRAQSFRSAGDRLLQLRLRHTRASLDALPLRVLVELVPGASLRTGVGTTPTPALGRLVLLSLTFVAPRLLGHGKLLSPVTSPRNGSRDDRGAKRPRRAFPATRLGPSQLAGYNRDTRLEPDFSATDGTADVAEDEEDDTDDEHDGADRVEDAQTGQPTDQQK